MAQPTYGRHRQSISNLEEELYGLISNHPRSHSNDNDEPVIPGDALVDIFASFSESHNNVELMSKEEEVQLIQFLADNADDIEATPKLLLEFIALRTTPNSARPRHPPAAVSSDDGSENDSPERGRREQPGVYEHRSRSCSTDSTGTSVHRPISRPHSRGPPTTPNSARDSPFDTSKRQRSTPLGNAAPSSWTKRPPPAHRRKSDAGGYGRALSDSESATTSGRRNSRSRAPSNPTSPIWSSQSQPNLPSGSFSTPSRPHSRNQSHPQPHFNLGGLGSYYGSPDHSADSPPSTTSLLSSPPGSADNSLDEVSLLLSINSLSMPQPPGDSDSDGEEPSMLVYDRSAASSNASLEPTERLEALQRINIELSKKLMEAEKTLQDRLTEHETDLEEMQGRLEEAKIELTATKKEEKELRTKERQNSTQISALETEIAKLQKSLDHSRISYQSLQKQYQEQCAESERYRNTLRRRDEEIRGYQDAAALQVLENQKWTREQLAFEERITQMEGELVIAQQAHVQLDGQKQENLLLKETIDRMRFDMDEMRSSAANALLQGASGTNSSQASLSRSFQAEMLRAGVAGGPLVPPEDEADTSGETEGSDIEDEDTEEEDYIQTIITKTRRRKVPGRPALATLHLEETTKEYSDASSQYDDSAFIHFAKTQTDPEPIVTTASLSTQTTETLVGTCSIQTDPEPTPVPRTTTEMEIQTDELELIPQEEEDTSVSSSSTLLPPTPKAHPEDHQLHDLPPAYNQVTDRDREELALKIANETLKQWHKGTKLPIEPLRAGVSLDAIEEWKALKEELGVECTVIEKILEESGKTGRPRPSAFKVSSLLPRSPRAGRFYNIYNTYVYGGGAGDPSGLITNMLLCIGASAVVVFFMTQGGSAQQYVIPGGPTYYDRAAWTSFNTMHASGEGFSGDGTSVVWKFLGRFAGGAARIVQGWPT